jgi:hypothetical protein
MNKKQIAIAWVMGFLMIASFIFASYTISFKKEVFSLELNPFEWDYSDDQYIKIPRDKYGFFSRKDTDYRTVTVRLMGRIAVILIVGGVLIYILRNKKSGVLNLSGDTMKGANHVVVKPYQGVKRKSNR